MRAPRSRIGFFINYLLGQLLIGGLIGAALAWGLPRWAPEAGTILKSDPGTLAAPAAAMLAVVVLGSALWWPLLRRSAARALGGEMAAAAPAAEPETGDRDALREAARRRDDQRLYLHLLSVLQREGRLMDFLYEDLDAYADAQIGAAVRAIHGSCRKTVERCLAPGSVLDAAEGEPTTVAVGFDPAAIKLTGNVTGDPPFEGIVRHRGWQAGRIELPTFSGDREAGILAPAEVEVV